MALTEAAREKIEHLLDNHRIVLFMKGTPQAPMCGFSANTAGILGALGPDFATFNVLEDEDVREGVKEFGQWPTIPQLYVDKELIGGNDIITQMFNAGELHELFGLEKPDRTPPEITISDAAAEAIRAGTQAQPGADLHFKIDDYWRAQFMLQPAAGGEIRVESNGIALHMDVLTAQRAKGVSIDYVDSLQGTGLSVNIPAAPPPVQSMSVEQLKAKMEAGDDVVIVDVRPDGEREKASLDQALVLDAEGLQAVNAMDKDTELVFLCHHGRSSLSTAEHFRKEGFTNLFNLEGGIEAWSREIDPSVPRY